MKERQNRPPKKYYQGPITRHSFLGEEILVGREWIPVAKPLSRKDKNMFRFFGRIRRLSRLEKPVDKNF